MNRSLWSARFPRSLWPFILLAVAFILLAIPAFMLGGVTWDEIFDFEGDLNSIPFERADLR